MLDYAFAVQVSDWPTAADDSRAVRQAVFVREQGIPAALEWDDSDADSVVALAHDAHDVPVGTARLMPDGQIGRMAVLPDWRGHGVGTTLMQALLHVAQSRGQLKLYVNSQVHAVGFYQKFGFRPQGPAFIEAGLPHRRMELRLRANVHELDPGQERRGE